MLGLAALRWLSRLFLVGRSKLGDGPVTQAHLRSGGGCLWDDSLAQYQVGDFSTYWELLGEVSYYQFRRMTGDGNKDFITYTIDYLRQHVSSEGLSGLSLGCSEGAAPEMRFAESGIFANFEVLDIAGKLLDRQRKIAQGRGLHQLKYASSDLNCPALPGERYDLIWAVGTIHHIERLESLFEQISLALKPNGIFVMREYVGPNQLQFTDQQLAITNRIFAVVPERYKLTPQGRVRGPATRVDKSELARIDPSESVRSADVLEVMLRYLKPVHLAMTGGTLLHPLLSEIASNFQRDETGRVMLQLIIAFEELLIDNEALPSDYVFCIAKRLRDAD